MIPFYFGSEERRKHAVFHPPAGEGLKGRAIVLCDAFGDEAIRAHRVLRAAADSMAGDRWNVFRFDYYGTGDSSGDHEHFSCAQATLDIHEAVDETLSMTGLSEVYLLGLRLGGSLAMGVSIERSDVAGAILWDPVIDGRDYVDHCLALCEDDVHGAQLGGFLLGPSLQEELKAIRLEDRLAKYERPLLMICTRPTVAHRKLANRCKHIDYREIEAPEAWTKDPDGNVRPIPAAVILALTQWVG